ncbi:MAG: LicD family protein [Clostridia bacterium]|nr:LicD family protein [Clostridia bacterium]
MREIVELDELKMLELDIMKKIHLFCAEQNINYYLSYGTLIGAVRHNGFIPWDDDIDIHMPRPDYEKFLKTFPDFAKQNGLMVVNRNTKPYYGRCFSKVIDVNTLLVEPQYKTDDPIGVFVDIWPLDGLPDGKTKRNFYNRYTSFLAKLILASSMKYDKNLSFFKRTAIVFAKSFKPHKLLTKLESIAKKFPFDSCNFIKCYSSGRSIFKKEEFSEKVLIRFEDTEFYAPVGYDSVLRKIYGDYMELPPLESRKPHHIMNTYYKENSDG